MALQTQTNNNFTNYMMKRIRESIDYQEDPANRVISRIWVTESAEFGFVYNVHIISDCNGFAESEKLFFQTMRLHPLKCATLSKFVGNTEKCLYQNIYGNVYQELSRQFDVLEMFAARDVSNNIMYYSNRFSDTKFVSEFVEYLLVPDMNAPLPPNIIEEMEAAGFEFCMCPRHKGHSLINGYINRIGDARMLMF